MSGCLGASNFQNYVMGDGLVAYYSDAGGRIQKFAFAHENSAR
jgi:hypothetical protein